MRAVPPPEPVIPELAPVVVTPWVPPAEHTRTARWHGGVRPTTKFVVWHATAGTTAESSLGWLNRASANTDKQGQAGYHALIERDGSIYWHTPLDRVAYHAGISAWPWPNGAPMNSRSLGIAFCNRQLPKSDPKFEVVTVEQRQTARWLLHHLAKTYPEILNRERQVRHRDCAPNRRADPTPATLDWDEFLDELFQ